MKEKNDELLHLLHEKDVIIRRLQNQLDVAKLYSQPPKKQFHCRCPESVDLDNKIRQIQLKMPCSKSANFSTSTMDESGKKKRNRSLSWTPGLQEAESTLIEDVELEEEGSNKFKAQSSTYDIKGRSV
jgi:hypothetical protein